MKLRVVAGRENFWQAVRKQQPDLSSYCGGNGSCGKCRIRVLSGEASVSAADRRHLSEQEIADGFRIACQSRPVTDCEIEVLPVDEEKMQVLNVEKSEAGEKQKKICDAPCSIAIDIGTTTLAFALLNALGDVIATVQGLNHQRSFGADVVSRIEKAVNGGRQELTDCIRRDIRQGIKALLEQAELPFTLVSRIAVAGNTTMEQLFFGLSVDSLGKYPFTPFINDFIESSYGQLFTPTEGWELGAEAVPVTGFPCIAGFVGGDITAGLYELTESKQEGTQMFLDLGTNGELACIRKDRIVTASTAAGPVFEGGNISCGIGCVPGAVFATRIREEMLECRTIDNRQALGICGSGLIEAVSDMLDLGIIDSSGRMKQAYHEHGYVLARTGTGKTVALTQADIREFQMAKAAVAAGIDILQKQLGVESRKITSYLLAGGFGSGLSANNKIIKTGLLPQNARGKTKSAGNTSLKGAIRLLREGEEGKKRINEMLAVTEYIHLANTEAFEACYISHMRLG